MLFIYLPFLTLSQTDDFCQTPRLCFTADADFRCDVSQIPLALGFIPSWCNLVPYLILERIQSCIFHPDANRDPVDSLLFLDTDFCRYGNSVEVVRTLWIVGSSPTMTMKRKLHTQLFTSKVNKTRYAEESSAGNFVNIRPQVSYTAPGRLTSTRHPAQYLPCRSS
jgi:hypothetical protein